jgi:hypothetical protein
LQNLQVGQPRHAEAQRPCRAIAGLLQRAEGVVDRRERRLHARKKASARFGEPDVPGRAVEQAHAQALFERADDLTHARGGEPELGRSGGEAALVGDDHELGDARQIGQH